jgi:hypothetical protein
MARPKSSKSVAPKDALGSWDSQRILQRAVSARAADLASEIVSELRTLCQDAMAVIAKDMRDPEVPAGVRSANARFIVQFTTDVLLNGDTDRAIKTMAVPIANTLDEVRERIATDPDYASALACGDTSVIVRGEGPRH